MSIKFKLMLAIDALVLLVVLIFGSILYTSEKTLLLSQMLASRESVLQSLAKVTEESVLSEDDAMLMSYTADLKRMVGELELAYVVDEHNMVLAHTDKELAPRPLPLSYQGQRMRSLTDKLLVRSKLPAADRRGISFARKRVIVGGKVYDVAVGYSDFRIRTNMLRALDSVLVRMVRAGALGLLVATLLALWLSSLLARPVRRLVAAFAATGEGDLGQELGDTSRRDEIGVLNREFNSMVRRLKELDELKKDFASSVTHELKSPLGAIESYLDLMSYDVAQSINNPGAWAAKLPKFLENISFVKQNSHRLLGFITDLLDTTKMEKGKFEISRRRAPIEPLINDAVKLFAERARTSGIELKAELPREALPLVNIDAERISQVLVNLVSNAVKFTPKGGKVTVAASVSEQAMGSMPEVKARTLKVLVKDTGIGIPAGDLAKIFDKFYQVPGGRGKAAGPKGTGLGLYIVKSIVEAHGGKVLAQSSSEGSELGFELPIRRTATL